MAESPVVAFLRSVQIKDIALKRKGVVVVHRGDSVVKALSVLVKNDILSAPVWDETKGVFIGSIDMHHIVNLIAKEFSEELLTLEGGTIEALMVKQKLFADKPIADIFDFSDRNPFHHLTNSESLYDAIDAMAIKTYVRRSLVFDDGATSFTPQNLQSIVSQTAIITFLSKHAASLGPVIHLPIDQAVTMDWATAKDKVVSVSAVDTLNHAFQLMFTQNVSGLAVLDDKATLMGTISIRDLKFMMVRDKLDLSWLKSSVREYMNFVRAQSDMERHPAISLRRSDSFGTLIAKIASTAVHRIFIIDDNNAPIGVVGTIDVLRGLMAHSQVAS